MRVKDLKNIWFNSDQTFTGCSLVSVKSAPAWCAKLAEASTARGLGGTGSRDAAQQCYRYTNIDITIGSTVDVLSKAEIIFLGNIQMHNEYHFEATLLSQSSCLCPKCHKPWGSLTLHFELCSKPPLRSFWAFFFWIFLFVCIFSLISKDHYRSSTVQNL